MQDRFDDSAERSVTRAVDTIRSIELPAESCRRAIEKAMRWQLQATAVPVPVPVPVPLRRRYAVLALTACISVAVLVPGLWRSFVRTEPGTRIPAGEPSPPSASQDAVVSYFEPVSPGQTSVAESATLIASLGPEQPVRFGDEVRYADYNRGLGPRQARLHLWDWSRSNESRVLVVDRDRLGTLSADGRFMLTREGKALDLETAKTTEFAGFAVEDPQRPSELGLSTSGRYAWLMIHVRTRVDPVPGNPGLSGAVHFWKVRVVDLKTEGSVGDFPAHAEGKAAFTPDERSFVHSDENNSIVRRDVSTGKVLHTYAPAVAGHGPVGLAISPDGRYLAAGQYHGKLYLWETATGRPVLESQFKRADGTDDTFFQAKLMRFSENGELLAVVSGSRLKVLEVTTGNVLAEHYAPTTPVFIHLRWGDDSQNLLLVAPSTPSQFRGTGFPAKAVADRLPQLYEWDWQSDKLEVREVP